MVQLENTVASAPRSQSSSEPASHTPTPWCVGQIGASGPKIYRGVPDGDAVCQLFDRVGVAFLDANANAALIVKAVNCHDALVSSLQEMIGIYWGEGDGQEPAPECIQRAQAALTQANL